MRGANRGHVAVRKARRRWSGRALLRPGTLNLTRIFIVDIGWQNPFRVCSLIGSIPRVARSSAFAWLRRDESQPWALLRNPFGIEHRCKVQRGRALSDTRAASTGSRRYGRLETCATKRTKETMVAKWRARIPLGHPARPNL